jgi:hypothetical protein
MPDLNTIPARSGAAATTKTGMECIIVPLADNIADMNSMYTLNETGAFIWEKIDGRNSIGTIIEALMNEYDVDRETAEADVFEFIGRMEQFLINSEAGPGA